MLRYWLSLSLAAVLPACSALVSLDGLWGGSQGVNGAPLDASTPVAPAVPVGADAMAASDATAATGGIDGADANGGTGAPDAADAASEAAAVASLLGVRCANVPTATFCDDFDGADLPTVWGQSPELTLGQLAHDASKSTSSPNSLRAEADPTTTSHSSVSIARNFPSIVSPMRGTLDFDMEVDQYGVDAALVVYFYFESPNGASPASYTLQVKLTPGAVSLVEDIQNVGPEQNGSAACPGPAPLTGVWHHFTFGYDLSVPSESVSIDGAPACSRTLAYASSRAVPWETGISLGLPWVDAQTACTWVIHQDSAVLRVP